MKKITLTVASLLLGGFLLAQDYTPPAKATASFSTKYPEGVVQEWYEGFNDVECYFENDGNYGSAHFSEAGAWLYTEFTVDESELPRAVAEMVADDFAGYEISDVTMKETPKIKTYIITIYEEETEDNRIVTYDEKGGLLDEVVISMDDDSSE
ncbi:MAG: PepSY-like domain-containing protein [bacterium]|nr:PepSY-like domain-containing protein [bacterium]